MMNKGKYVLFSICLIAAEMLIMDTAKLKDISERSIGDIYKIIFLGGNDKDLPNSSMQMILYFCILTLIYLLLYSKIDKTSSAYRCLQLYRYGKKRYLKMCMKQVVQVLLLEIFIMCIGIFITSIWTIGMESIYSPESGVYTALLIQLLKMFLAWMVIGCWNVYMSFREKYVIAIPITLVYLFFQIIVDKTQENKGLITYGNTEVNLIYSGILCLILGISMILIYRNMKKISLL